MVKTLDQMPTLPPVERRVVLREPSGLYRIFGVLTEQPPSYVPAEDGALIEGRMVAVNLVATKRRYYLYKPVMIPGEDTEPSTFHEEQQ